MIMMENVLVMWEKIFPGFRGRLVWVLSFLAMISFVLR